MHFWGGEPEGALRARQRRYPRSTMIAKGWGGGGARIFSSRKGGGEKKEGLHDDVSGVLAREREDPSIRPSRFVPDNSGRSVTPSPSHRPGLRSRVFQLLLGAGLTPAPDVN